ncbi:MAG TPA: alanine--tRNA ligase-related protein, partial [Gaiellaceae bacterium]|nr:alanine--tRNA ligase-related protein [Gaiellaceae bacterium]
MRTTADIREGFLRFFEEKSHTRLPSAPVIPPPEDTSTLLISAGMQPLKPYFLGQKAPPATLLTTYQKVFRTTDIDEVGLDGYHLSFFEMMGNFSIGEYFKEGAVEHAWEFMHDRLDLDFEKLWVSVFAGDPGLGLGEDEVAIAAWEAVGQPRERIVGLPRTENFWQAGETGPCGPCSEMYYDRGAELSCGRPDCGPGCPCERYLEFWNLVFMEFDLGADGILTPLPKPVIDTGLGLERTAAIQQDVITVYETDGFQALMDWIEAESGVAWTSSEKATKAHRIMADHGRGMTFLVADGVLPSNEGRG